ncbi:MAG: hypothetical protein O3C27_02815 [Actinomycetota bacterium]|nr:hypothetical protein [Actinomycetota bacterium]
MDFLLEPTAFGHHVDRVVAEHLQLVQELDHFGLDIPVLDPKAVDLLGDLVLVLQQHCDIALQVSAFSFEVPEFHLFGSRLVPEQDDRSLRRNRGRRALLIARHLFQPLERGQTRGSGPKDLLVLRELSAEALQGFFTGSDFRHHSSSGFDGVPSARPPDE